MSRYASADAPSKVTQTRNSAFLESIAKRNGDSHNGESVSSKKKRTSSKKSKKADS